MNVADSEPPSSEAQLLSVIASELADAGQTPDLSDDCAYLQTQTALITTDALIQGRHFDLRWDTPLQVGRQAAVVNLSDLAGSGGQAGWLLWSLSIPSQWTRAMIRELTRGFAQVAQETGARVMGGNLALTTGPAVINVTAGGALAGPRPLTRKGARPGDRVYVTGPLGEHALGYLNPTAETRALRHSWRPHLDEAGTLAHLAGVTACMDISDGLLIDAARLARTSGLHIALESARLPVSDEFSRLAEEHRARALFGGEDYVLLFTASPDTSTPEWATVIGSCDSGAGLSLDDTPVTSLGFDHFSEVR